MEKQREIRTVRERNDKTNKRSIEEIRERLQDISRDNIKAFITDVHHNFYFCYVTDVKEYFVTLKSFAGKRKGEEDILFVRDIYSIKPYREEITDEKKVA